MKWHYALWLGLLWSMAQPAQSSLTHSAFWPKARTEEREIHGGRSAWPVDSGRSTASYRGRCYPRPCRSRGKHAQGVGWMETSSEKAVDSGTRRRKGNDSRECGHGERWEAVDDSGTRGGRRLHGELACLGLMTGGSSSNPVLEEEATMVRFPSAWMASREHAGGRRRQAEMADGE
jgi:hypothetical protein